MSYLCSSFCSLMASFSSLSASGLDTGLEMLFRYFQTCSLSFAVFAEAKGFRSFFPFSMYQRYDGLPIYQFFYFDHRVEGAFLSGKSLVSYREHMQPGEVDLTGI